jgi:glycosyltransferase involved in cell wall biosynthesis
MKNIVTPASLFYKYIRKQNPHLVTKIENVNNLNQIKDVEVSIVIPVFNQELIIVDHLTSLIKNCTTCCEIIIISDASTDDTLSELKFFLLNIKSELSSFVFKISLYSFRKQVFETFCDVAGFNLSSGKFIIEIQADIRINEYGFDSKLINVLKKNQDIFLISGRGVVSALKIKEDYDLSNGSAVAASKNLFYSFKSKIKLIKNSKEISRNISNNKLNINPNANEFFNLSQAGRLGPLIEHKPTKNLNLLYVGDSGIRGPICFEKKRYVLLGGLNYNAFFLGFDDHEINIRARQMYDWKSAYIYIDFDSDLDLGSTRKQRSRMTSFYIWMSIMHISKQKNSIKDMDINQIRNKNEVRDIN